MLACILLMTQAIHAAPPPNDACSNAEVIPGDGPFPYLTEIAEDVREATTVGDPPSPSCVFGGISRSIWYRFIPGVTRLYTISANTDTGTTVLDTVMAVYSSASGCSGPFTEVECNDDEGTLKSAISTSLNAGVTYYIVVWVGPVFVPTPGRTAVQLRVTAPVTPVNDLCSGAEVLPGSGPFPHLSSVADTTLATENGDPVPACIDSASRGVWYRFTPAQTATYRVSTCGETATTVFDTAMAVYTSAGGCAGPFVEVGCDDNGCGQRGTITAALNAGTTYYIVVWETLDEEPVLGETSVQVRVVQFGPPTVTTLPATEVTSTSAVLNGTVNPNGGAATAWFEWGTNTSYGQTTPIIGVGSGDTALPVNAQISGLSPGVAYHFRLGASSNLGTNHGSDRVFQWSNTRPTLGTVSRLPDGTIRLQFTGTPGQLYVIDASIDLVAWTAIGTATDQGNGSFTFEDDEAAGLAMRFYRLRSP